MALLLLSWPDHGSALSPRLLDLAGDHAGIRWRDAPEQLDRWGRALERKAAR